MQLLMTGQQRLETTSEVLSYWPKELPLTHAAPKGAEGHRHLGQNRVQSRVYLVLWRTGCAGIRILAHGREARQYDSEKGSPVV